MAIKDAIKPHGMTAWTLAILALVLMAGAGVAASVQPTDPADPAETLRQIESILRDHRLDANQRIEEALRTLEGATQAASQPLLTPVQPVPDPFDRFSQPLTPFSGAGFDPFREMERMHREMQQMMEGAFGSFGSMQPPMLLHSPRAAAPFSNLEARPDAYLFRFELPGVNDVEVRVEHGQLVLESRQEVHDEHSTGDDRPARRVIQHNQFRHVTPLPADVDLAAPIQTQLEDGRLTVTLKRRVEPRRPVIRNNGLDI